MSDKRAQLFVSTDLLHEFLSLREDIRIIGTTTDLRYSAVSFILEGPGLPESCAGYIPGNDPWLVDPQEVQKQENSLVAEIRRQQEKPQ